MQQLLQALTDPRVVVDGKLKTVLEMDHTENIVCPGRCAEQQQEPRALKIGHLRGPVPRSRSTALQRILHDPEVPRIVKPLPVMESPPRHTPFGVPSALCNRCSQSGGLFSTPVLHLSLPLVHLDPGVVLRLFHRGHSVWQRHDVHVVEESHQRLGRHRGISLFTAFTLWNLVKPRVWKGVIWMAALGSLPVATCTACVMLSSPRSSCQNVLEWRRSHTWP